MGSEGIGPGVLSGNRINFRRPPTLQPYAWDGKVYGDTAVGFYSERNGVGILFRNQIYIVIRHVNGKCRTSPVKNERR